MGLNADLTGIQSLKFMASEPGVADLTAKGWVVLGTLQPADGLTYTLLGLPDQSDAAKLKRLEKELADLRAKHES